MDTAQLKNKSLLNVKTIPGEKLKILNYARERFFLEGFYKISMDEIARELSISKTTLYKYFPSKLELVNESIFSLASEVKNKIEYTIDSDTNAVEKFLTVIETLTATITKFSDKWMKDLQYHAPHIWKKVDEMRRVMMFENISKIIMQGQKEGLIEKYPPEIIITLIVGSMRSVVNPQFLVTVSLSYNDAVENSFRILLNGILTKKGLKIFNYIKSRK